MENKQEIRQSDNKVLVEGVVKENNLKKLDDTTIAGHLILATSSDSEHKVNFYATAKTKAGADSKSYANLTHALEYVSMVDLIANGHTQEEALEQATKVIVKSGELKMNDYYNADRGNLSSFPEIKANFVETIKKEFNPRAEFDIEGVITSIAPEMTTGDDPEETGRVKVKLVAFDYKGAAMPFEFVASGDTATYLTIAYEINKTSNVWGVLENSIERKVVKKEGFGSSKEEVFENVTREMVITSGQPEQVDEESPLAYKLEAVKTALAEREVYLEGLKNKDDNKKKGFGQPASTQTSPTSQPTQADKVRKW